MSSLPRCSDSNTLSQRLRTKADLVPLNWCVQSWMPTVIEPNQASKIVLTLDAPSILTAPANLCCWMGTTQRYCWQPSWTRTGSSMQLVHGTMQLTGYQISDRQTSYQKNREGLWTCLPADRQIDSQKFMLPFFSSCASCLVRASVCCRLSCQP